MNAPRMTSRPSSSASATKPDEQDERGADADLRGGVLQAASTSPQSRIECSTPAMSSADQHRDHEQPPSRTTFDAVEPVAREEEREQDHRGEVGDRGGGDHELPEGRADLVGVLEDGHEDAERGRRQHDGDEQRRLEEAAGLQHEPDQRPRSRTRARSRARQRAAPGRAGARRRSPGRRGRAGRPGRPVDEDLDGVVDLDPAEHGGPDEDPDHDLEHDRRAVARAGTKPSASGAAKPAATMISRFVNSSSMALRSPRRRRRPLRVAARGVPDRGREGETNRPLAGR